MASGSCGSSEGSQDFLRSMTSREQSYISAMAPWGYQYRTDQTQGSAVPGSVRTKENAFLESLLGLGSSNILNKSAVEGTMSPTSSYTSALPSIAAVNPYSTDYLTQMSGVWDELFAKAVAQARTGPEAVRGGTAHGAMVESDLLERSALDAWKEMIGLQQAQAATTTQAAATGAGIENTQRQSTVGAQDTLMKQYLQMLATQVGGSQAVTGRAGEFSKLIAQIFGTASRNRDLYENAAGKGTQAASGSQWGGGLSCCFIFLEATNGVLPWWVRRARDVLCSPNRVSGYRHMSARLVPAMRHSVFVKWLVNVFMVKPMTHYGAWFFGVNKWGWIFQPVKAFWFKVWDIIGKE